MAEDAQLRIRATMDIGDVVSNIGAIQKSFSNLKLPDNLSKGLNKNISEFYKEYEKYQKRVATGIKTQGDYNQIEKSLNRMRSLYGDIGKELEKTTKLKIDDIIDLGSGNFKGLSDEISNQIKKINSVKIDKNAILKPLEEIRGLTKSKRISGDNGLIDQIIGNINKGKITEAKSALTELLSYANKVATRTDESGKLIKGTMGKEKYSQLQSALKTITSAFDQADAEAAPFIARLNELQAELAETKSKAGRDIIGNVTQFKNAEKDVEKVTDSLKRLHAEEFSFNRQAQDIDRQIQSYFGLSQMIRKVGDIARDAFNTVKELDAAMVETAVVTNFSVGDMWDMLPIYTKNANQLGSTIKDVYEAATLYYQQGLNQTQSMSLANETLKMARIGGLQAADATNMMTAALRGFNMEINQTSAQRINDVYSELAAITAADTKEIGSAMERTASIADSANMEFETTSAFLAQMIETTREAPENLGTAMKTIIARFQEMKQDPTKLVDSEGVAMDVNKIDTALKTIGVNLTNTKGEFRDLDDVFLDISEKWSGLTQGQQRYIATIAAGSRQQSRFIAMMQNYERVKELVDAANNSAGASQKQFEKTLDSMASKLNKFKNAWDQFTMGLMNNQILKGVVDGLTGIFTVVNKVINALGSIPPSPFEGITKSALTLVSTLGMLQFGKRAARGAIFAGAGWWKNEGKIAENFREGWGPRIQKERGEPTDRRQEYWNRVEGRLTQNAKERVIKTPIDVETYLRKIDTSDLDVRVKDQIEQELDKIGDEPITEDVQVKINNIIDQDAKGDESLHITDDMVEGIPKLDQFEGKINSLASRVGQVGDLFEQLGDSIGGPFGSALSTVGSLLNTLSITLEATATSFMANFTAELQAAAAADVNTEATLRMQVAQAGAAGTAKALGKALWSSLGPLVAIAAIAGVAFGAYKLLDAAYVSNKERLEASSNAAAKASEAFDLANQDLSELRDSISKIRETETAFDSLVVGTAQFNEQLVTANQQITELINKYPMLMDNGYVSTDKNGLMHISETGLKEVEEYQKKLQSQASAASVIQAADLSALENEQKALQLRKDAYYLSGKEKEQKETEADLLIQQAEAGKEVARQNAIRTTLNGTEVKNVEALSAIYTDLYESKRKAAEQSLETVDQNQIRQQYADYYGYTYNQSTKEMKNIEGDKVEYDDKVLKDAVIEQTVLLDFEEKAGSLEKALDTLDTKFNESFGKNFEGSSNFISDLLGSNIEANEDLLKEVLENPKELQEVAEGLTKEEIAAVLDISAGSITDRNIESYQKKVADLLSEKASNLVEMQGENYTQLAQMMAQSSGKTVENMLKERNQEKIVAQIDKLNAEQTNLLTTIGSKLQENVGAETMKTFIDQASDIYLKQGEQTKAQFEKTKQDFTNILNEINWDSATSRLEGYNKAIDSSNKKISDWGTTMRASANESNLLGEAFDEFLGGEWTELSENADEFKNSLGEIDGAGILKASEQSRVLKSMLDSGEVSATGLAKALQGVEDGSISQVNSTVLQLLSSLNRLNDAAAEAHNIIENFDAGVDTGEGEDFIKENAEAVQEYMKNNEWGNEQLQNYIKLAAGEDRWNKAMREHHGNLKLVTKDLDQYVTKFKDGFQPAYNDMIAGKGINGKTLVENINNSIKAGRIDETLGDEFKKVETYWDENGFMQWEFGDLTTDQLEQYFQEAYGVSEKYAKLFLQDILNYNETEGAKLAANDLKATINSEEFKRSNTDKDGNLVLSNADVQAFRDAGGYESTKDALAALNDAAGETVETFRVVDKEGTRLANYPKLLENYAKTFYDVGKKGIEGLFEQPELQTQGQFDLAKYIADSQQKGFDEEQSMRSAWEAYLKAQELNKPTLYEGMELKDGISTYDQFTEEIQTLTDSSQWVTVGQTIGQQIVAAIQGVDLLNQIKEGEATSPFTDAGFSQGTFSQVVEAIKTSNETKDQQQESIISYLQQSKQDFANMNQDQQISALQGIVSQLNELDFNAGDITAAIKDGLGVDLNPGGNKPVLSEESGTVELNADSRILQEQLNNLEATVEVTGHFAGFTGGSFSSKASGQNNPNSLFRTGTMARGSRRGYTISGRPTLTGEEGEELVWEPKRNEAYMVGSNGPQFANISKSAVVWDADQTRRIKKNSGSVGRFGTGARGITPLGTMAGGSGGGGGYKIPGVFDVDAMANIEDIKPPEKKPEIPVKAKLEVEGNNKGGLLNKIKGLFGKGDKGGPSVKVTAEATKITTPEGKKTSVKVIGDITKLNNKAGKLKNVKATATVNKVIKSGKVSGEPVTVKAKASVSTDTGKVEKKVSKVASAATKTQKMTIDANNGPAMTKVNQVINRIKNSKPTLTYSVSGPSSVTVPVYASFRGSWEKSVKINRSGAKGINNNMPRKHTPQIGSMARGRYGRLGPKGKGGPTLTGEKGFEIAWLPSESRSLILGANGPQMIDLPKDAVVWTNEQSKKILKQKAIPAGSHSGRTQGGTGGSSGGGGNSGGGSNGSRSGGSGGDGGKQAKKNQKKHIKILDKAGKIATWWWNMTKKVEATQRKIDKLTKDGEKFLKEVGTTLTSFAEKFGNELIKKLNLQKKLNTDMRDKARDKLEEINTKKTRQKTKNRQKKVNKDEKKLLRARETKSKKDDKKARKRLKKDTKKLRKTQKGANWANISYEAIERTKQGKKVTKKKVTKKDRINLSKYISFDEETGAYVVDRKAIKKDFGKTKKGQAVRDAAQKRLDNYVGKRDTAEDNIDKANEALEQLGQNLYDEFFGWETELTKIWNITQKIAEAEGRRERAESFNDLLDAQINSDTVKIVDKLGNINSEYLDKITGTFGKGVREQVNTIGLTITSIGEQAKSLQKTLSFDDEQITLDNITQIINENKAYTEAQEAAAKAENKLKKSQTKLDDTKQRIKDLKADKKDAKKTDTKKDDKKVQNKLDKAKDKRDDLKETVAENRAAFNAAQAEVSRLSSEMPRILDETELLAYEYQKKALEDQVKINEIIKNNDLLKTRTNSDGTISIDFNTESFEDLKQSGQINSTTAEKIQEYVKKIVDDSKTLQDTYKDLTDQLTELHTSLAELKEAWVGYSDDLMSYLEDSQEADIEKYKALSDSIRDALDKLLDQVKKNLEERRRQEDNAKTERDISQKQQRLAALRADTAGGHQVEIAQLEKEIADAQSDYGRTLEDQLLDRLSDQAEVAEEQRERIIELQQAINDTVNNAAIVNKWMANPKDYIEEIRAAFFKANDWEKLPLAKQEALETQFQTLIAGLLTNQDKQKSYVEAIEETTAAVELVEESLTDVGQDVNLDTENSTSIDETVREIANQLGASIDKTTQAVVDLTEHVDDNAEAANDATNSNTQAVGTNTATSNYNTAFTAATSDSKLTVSELKNVMKAGGEAGYTPGQIAKKLAGTSKLTWKIILTAAKDANYTGSQVKQWWPDADKNSNFRKAFAEVFTKKKWSEYATGGIADFTGPAWLDGTPSKPELVLNSTDTKNFIALRDVLSNAMGSINNSNETLTNTSYEININVDHINNDYDVDKIAARIKKDIVKDAGYRNVTQVRNLR